jgi:general stress protein YciG
MCEVIKEGFRVINAWKPFNLGGKPMAGTKLGGQKAAAKNLAKDPAFYAKIGAKGGRNGHTGGFAANPELARIAGAKGGRISRRKSKKVSA